MTKPTLAQVLLAELERDPATLEHLRELIGEKTSPDDDRWLTPIEAADRLGLHPNTLTRAAKAGRVPGATQDAAGGRAWRFRASELKLLPPARPSLPDAGPGRAARLPQRDSSATQAIRGTKAA